MIRQLLHAGLIAFITSSATSWAKDPAKATAAATHPVHAALIIGVSRYGPPGVTPLPGVPHDIQNARKIAEAMGIHADQVRVLRDHEATKAATLSALAQLTDTLTPGGRALVYFSGHGTRQADPRQGQCLESLLTYEGQSISHDEFARATQALSRKADKLITLFDACHSEGVLRSVTRGRSAADTALVAKYSAPPTGGFPACDRIANQTTRSSGLLTQQKRLGAFEENTVHISSSRPDEVSFDDPKNGGLATQGLTQCLLDGRTDSDGSGAINWQEIQACAQGFINKRVAGAVGITPHHVTITGNRNLIVMPTPAPATAPATTEAPAPAAIPEPMVVAAPIATPMAAAEPAPAPPAQPTPPTPPTPLMAATATLRDIAAQSNPARSLKVLLTSTHVKIGEKLPPIQVRSGVKGYVYLILLGSDERSFYVLFPNRLDSDNTITANRAVTLPRPQWQIQAAGPAGTNQLLVVVTGKPLAIDALIPQTGASTDVFATLSTDLTTRADLIRRFLLTDQSRAVGPYAAKLLTLEETP